MAPLGNPRDHFWLTIGMAKALKVDLGAALAEGRLTRAEYAGMVTRCRACSKPCDCRARLDSLTPLDAVPDYCTNRQLMTDLAEG